MQSLRIMQKLSAVPKNHHHAFILTERTFDHSIQKCATLGLEINIYLMYISQQSIALYTSEIYEPTRTISKGLVDRNDGRA